MASNSASTTPDEMTADGDWYFYSPIIEFEVGFGKKAKKASIHAALLKQRCPSLWRVALMTKPTTGDSKWTLRLIPEEDAIDDFLWWLYNEEFIESITIEDLFELHRFGFFNHVPEVDSAIITWAQKQTTETRMELLGKLVEGDDCNCRPPSSELDYYLLAKMAFEIVTKGWHVFLRESGSAYYDILRMNLGKCDYHRQEWMVGAADKIAEASKLAAEGKLVDPDTLDWACAPAW